MSVVLIDQEIVHYEVLGRGKPLIFLHGWIGSWRYWIPTMQACSVSCRAYALDLWGFGDTQKNPRHYSLADQSLLVEQFLEKLGIARVALVGHGLGALVAMDFSARHPQVVDRQLLIAYPWDESKLSGRLNANSSSELADWLLGKLPITEPARMDAPRADPESIKTIIKSLASLEIASVRKKSAVPSLFVYGQNDPVIPPPEVDDDLRNLPETSHTIVFEQSGHFPMLDEGSKLNRLLADFLALPGGESPRELQLKEEWKRRVR